MGFQNSLDNMLQMVASLGFASENAIVDQSDILSAYFNYLRQYFPSHVQVYFSSILIKQPNLKNQLNFVCECLLNADEESFQNRLHHFDPKYKNSLSTISSQLFPQTSLRLMQRSNKATSPLEPFYKLAFVLGCRFQILKIVDSGTQATTVKTFGNGEITIYFLENNANAKVIYPSYLSENLLVCMVQNNFTIRFHCGHWLRNIQNSDVKRTIEKCEICNQKLFSQDTALVRLETSKNYGKENCFNCQKISDDMVVCSECGWPQCSRCYGKNSQYSCPLCCFITPISECRRSQLKSNYGNHPGYNNDPPPESQYDQNRSNPISPNYPANYMQNFPNWGNKMPNNVPGQIITQEDPKNVIAKCPQCRNKNTCKMCFSLFDSNVPIGKYESCKHCKALEDLSCEICKNKVSHMNCKKFTVCESCISCKTCHENITYTCSCKLSKQGKGTACVCEPSVSGNLLEICKKCKKIRYPSNSLPYNFQTSIPNVPISKSPSGFCKKCGPFFIVENMGPCQHCPIIIYNEKSSVDPCIPLLKNYLENN